MPTPPPSPPACADAPARPRTRLAHLSSRSHPAAMTGIDLNTVEEDEEEAEKVAINRCHHSQASSAGTGATPRPSAVCLELWHACAGPVAPLPRKGSVVVYLPQGHLEHLGDAAAGGAVFAVPPQVFCRVVDVTLHADAATDEVYAQLSLVAEDEVCEQLVAKDLHGTEWRFRHIYRGQPQAPFNHRMERICQQEEACLWGCCTIFAR